MVFLEGAGHEFFEALDASAVAGVGGHEFSRLRALAGGGHALPKGDGFAGVVSGAGHVEEAHLVGFGLVLASEGEDDAVLGTCAEEAEEHLALAEIHIAHGKGGTHHGGLEHALLKDALGAMAGDGVGHFVAHNDGEASFGFGDGQDSGKDDDFAAGQAKGVGSGVADNADGPFKVFGGRAGDWSKPASNAGDEFDFRAALDNVGLGEDFLKGLEAEGGFLFGAEADPDFFAGFGIGEFFGAKELPGNNDASDNDRYQFETAAASSAMGHAPHLEGT